MGTPLCSSHACRHCKELVNPLSRHSLSCWWSEGRHYRHSALNDIVCRALSSAYVPAVLEPSGLSRSDGKCPDDVTIAPWSSGKSLVCRVLARIKKPNGLKIFVVFLKFFARVSYKILIRRFSTHVVDLWLLQRENE